MATPLSLLNRGKGVGHIADTRATGWSRLQSRHAEEAKEKGHQRCYHYSLHLDYLAFLSRHDPDLSQQLLTGPGIRALISLNGDAAAERRIVVCGPRPPGLPPNHQAQSELRSCPPLSWFRQEQIRRQGRRRGGPGGGKKNQQRLK